jgi:hypothetical protein
VCATPPCLSGECSVVTDVPFRWGPIPESVWPGVRLRASTIDAVTFQPLQTVPLMAAGDSRGVARAAGSGSGSQGALALVGLKAYGQGNMTYASGAVSLAVNGGPPTPLSFDLASFLVTDDS